MTVTFQRVDSAFAPGLPFRAPKPTAPNLLWRYAAAKQPMGLLGSLDNDHGVARPATATGDARPTVQLVSDRPAIRFGADDVMTATGVPIAAPFTIFVAAMSAWAGTKRCVLLDMAGAFLEIRPDGRLWFTGSSGGVGGPVIPAGQRFVAAVSLEGTTATMEALGAVSTGTITVGALPRLRFGGVGTSLYWEGDLYEASGHSGVVAAADRGKQLAAWRSQFEAI